MEAQTEIVSALENSLSELNTNKSMNVNATNGTCTPNNTPLSQSPNSLNSDEEEGPTIFTKSMSIEAGRILVNPNTADSDSDMSENGNSTISSTEMDLGTAIEETTVAMNLFLNNKFEEAKSRMQPWADRSMYHTLGYGTIMYLQAAMTFEMKDVEAAVTAVKQSVSVCHRFRKRTGTFSSISSAVTKTNYNNYTEEQIHAELCYAECLMERALLTFVQDENLISFVKGSLKIRQCYNSYKECLKILQKRTWENDKERTHFESGTKLGIGLFNLMISLLPTKILKLLEVVGFSGNKAKGLADLEEGSKNIKSLRGPLCSISLLGYHTVMTYVLGTADGDIELCERLLEPCLENYPKGALFLFFAGRVEEIKGNIDAAIVKFEESIESQEEWRQFHHLCFWELMWCHSFKGDWLLAMKYAEKLYKESRWSRATYMYQKASFLMMCDDQTEETQAHLEYVFGEVPKLKQKIAGKSIPIEKFAVKKSKRYVSQGNRLTLPAFELIYVWNGFSIIGKKEEMLTPILSHVEKTVNELVENKDKLEFYDDDYCLALLLKGVCLKHKQQLFQAEMCFKEVIEFDKKLKQDPYLIPYSMMELALLQMQMENYDEAKKLLTKAKSYKGISLESRLHFRIHAANLQLKTLMDPEASNSVDLDSASSPPASPKDVSVPTGLEEEKEDSGFREDET